MTWIVKYSCGPADGKETFETEEEAFSFYETLEDSIYEINEDAYLEIYEE